MYLRAMALMLLVWTTTSASVADTSYIQIKCPPRVDVFLDGTFKGTTQAALGGLIIETSPGKHRIKLVKEACDPQYRDVALDKDQVLEVIIREFVPQVAVTQEGEEENTNVRRKVGTLLLQTIPIDCVVLIPTLHITARDNRSKKSKDKWQVSGVPEGRYEGTLLALQKEMKITFEVRSKKTTHLLVNIIKGTVRDIGKEEEDAARQKAAEAARRQAELERERSGPSKVILVFHPVIQSHEKRYREQNFSWGARLWVKRHPPSGDGKTDEELVWEEPVRPCFAGSNGKITVMRTLENVPPGGARIRVDYWYELIRQRDGGRASGKPYWIERFDVPPNRLVAIRQKSSDTKYLEVKVFKRTEELAAWEWAEEFMRKRLRD